ncbi:MAG: T9SS type A sorting domain-containing protein [Saprospiraceae bacterium]
MKKTTFPILLALFSLCLPTVQSQEYDWECCLGGSNPQPLCVRSGTPEPGFPDLGLQYQFPQLVTCNGISAVLEPADAGEILSFSCDNSASGCNPKVCVRWDKPGYNKIKVFYQCPFWLESRTRTVYVSLSGVNYASFTLSGISNCGSPNSSITVNRSSVNSGPVKKHRILVYPLDANNNIINPPMYDSGWQNGDMVSKTVNSGNGLNFAAGTRYKVRFQTQSACGTHDVIGNTIIFGAGPASPLVDFQINGLDNFPVALYTCNASPMIMNDNTDFPGCNPAISMARITMEMAADCNASIAGTEIVMTVPFASAYNLRTLFPTYTNLPGLYRITYELQGLTGWLPRVTHCVSVNGLNASNAEFKLKAPNNGVPINRDAIDFTAANVPLGDFSCGLYLQNTTSEVGTLDYYRVEIWRTDGGNNIETILNSGNIPINPQAPFPLGYDFNPPTGLYFFFLSPANKQNYRFRVRFTVHNQCGEAYKESFFKITTACTGCLTTGGNGGETDFIEVPLEEIIAERQAVTSSASLIVAPNPVSNVLNVRFDLRQSGNADFGLFDTEGRQVIRFQRQVDDAPVSLEETFDVAQLPSGVYIWRFVYGTQVESGRVIKN